MSTVHDNLRYPIGPYEPPTVFTDEILSRWIAILDDFPARLTQETAHLTDEQLDTRYRPKGWSIRQVVHHCADSHFNSFVRFKLALTEEKPVIKPYFEDRWAELVDGESTPIEPSLKIIEGLHERWVNLLKSLGDVDWHKTFVHPEHGREIPLNENLGLYAWHCNHHLAHITTLKESKGWE
jgi:hypothetical protein